MSDIEKMEVFLKNHPNPKVTIVGTIVKGGIVCMNPIPTISGPEIYCHHDQHQKVVETIRNELLNVHPERTENETPT